MKPSRARGRLLLAALILSALRCATAYTRGIVEDPGGAAVPGAAVRLVGADDRLVAADATDAHGCFFIQRTAPKGEKRFTLEITAPGYKAVRRDVPLQPPIFLATLVPSPSPGESAIRPTTAAERRDLWEPRCIPLFAGGGAQQLSPH